MRHELTIGARRVSLLVRPSRRARRLALRLDPATGEIVLVLPPRANLTQGLRFAAENSTWISDKLALLPPAVALVDGAVVPVLGRACRVRHRPDVRGGVWREGDEINVSGAAEHLPRRVRDWLKAQARRELAARSHAAAGRLGQSVSRVSVREMQSRWGSCSAKAALAFCWRLVLAPEPVMDYVVAHEVAHLAEMNHGPRFWSLVRGLSPDMDEARRWLRKNGPGLLRYG
jgi:predicted metal-dependent hydrolase